MIVGSHPVPSKHRFCITALAALGAAEDQLWMAGAVAGQAHFGPGLAQPAALEAERGSTFLSRLSW
ncbi:MAG: hypothetical protein JRI23_24995 [Deltaproteobacteria bacterium]|jgi:hypothetical protein|nr:hypothetical protein [Deltaproteobacteria bacterium]MBW2535274.1 hypothetical protein [Deltaproteobacteria bacterium]